MSDAFDEGEQEPEARLQIWIDAAAAAGSREPTAMCLATADARAVPSARIVLLRGLDRRGLQFFTSYSSRKGRELAENAHAAATFYWSEIERQVRVEGVVTLLSAEESDAYFRARPRGHQLAAWASEQSEPLKSRTMLEERFDHFAQRFEGDVPRPHSWGGYLIAAWRYEFWQRRPHRLHDRVEYVRDGPIWRVSRLSP
jgi:pyridoxamine 5'-phosphate oxidase